LIIIKIQCRLKKTTLDLYLFYNYATISVT